MPRLAGKQAGFTILELMIASSVLAVLLLLVTAIMTNIGNEYYKGINQSNVQDDVRTIANDVSANLQLNSSATTASIPGTASAYCIGSTRYTYAPLNTLAGDPYPGGGTYQHLLWRDTSSICTPADLSAASPSTNGVDLLIPNARLTSFTICSAPSCLSLNGSPYSLTLSIAFGANDLLNLSGYNTTCKLGTGDQFCATAGLITFVTQRVE